MTERKQEKISFRVTEEKSTELKRLAKEKDISLSELFRDYASKLQQYDGDVSVVSKSQILRSGVTVDSTFPPKVEVTSSMVREHERLELETEHLREALEEIKVVKRNLEERVSDEDQISLEEIDRLNGNADELE